MIIDNDELMIIVMTKRHEQQQLYLQWFWVVGFLFGLFLVLVIGLVWFGLVLYCVVDVLETKTTTTTPLQLQLHLTYPYQNGRLKVYWFTDTLYSLTGIDQFVSCSSDYPLALLLVKLTFQEFNKKKLITNGIVK